jgi:hypothetical protein
MDNEQKTAEKPPVLIMEEVPDQPLIPEGVDQLVPAMNVNVPEAQPEKPAVTDEQCVGMLTDIMDTIKSDRHDVYIDRFADLVINDGDATTSSKEALINLIKVKVDLSDKMLKAADLISRLRSKNTYAYSGPHLNAMQQNNFNIGTEETNFDRKEIIRALNQAKKKKDKS